MKRHTLRLDEVSYRAKARRPVFALGERVTSTRRVDKPTGVVTAIFVDFNAVVENGLVTADWYELQRPRPKTNPGGVWYSVLFREFAILEGEQDLVTAGVGLA